jgi:hypothetical protein
MTFRRRFLQFSFRTMLVATFLGIVAGQTYRVAVYDRQVREATEKVEAKIDKVFDRCEKIPPRCGIIFLGQLSRELDDSPDYRGLPARERSRLGSRIEAERFVQFSCGDQMAALKPKPTQFIKVDDMVYRP